MYDRFYIHLSKLMMLWISNSHTLFCHHIYLDKCSYQLPTFSPNSVPKATQDGGTVVIMPWAKVKAQLRVSKDWSCNLPPIFKYNLYIKTWESLVFRITLRCQSSSLQKNCIHSTSNLLTTKRNKKHVWLPGLEGEGGAYHESGDVSQLGNSQKLRRNGCGETTKFGRASNFEIHPYLL